MDFEKLYLTRRSHRSYVPGKAVPRATIEKLLGQASFAPSSYNQQGWRIIVVTDQKMKEQMYEKACQQQQVLDSSAMLIVCGNLEQYKNLPEVVSKTEGMDTTTQREIVEGAAKAYGSNPQLARDEAIRSSMLFSMSFLLAAANAGFGTGPMIGFDSAKMCELFEIKHPYFPMLLISFGVVKDAPFPQGYRRPVKDFARFV